MWFIADLGKMKVSMTSHFYKHLDTEVGLVLFDWIVPADVARLWFSVVHEGLDPQQFSEPTKAAKKYRRQRWAMSVTARVESQVVGWKIN